MQIKINKEFQALIPPLSPEELIQLEANILRDGIRDPLVVWAKMIYEDHKNFEFSCPEYRKKSECNPVINSTDFYCDVCDLFVAPAQYEYILVDGHNRYQIAQKHGLKFEVEEKEFEDEDEVKEWMILHQFGRRNLSNYQRSVLALKLEEVFRVKAKEKEAERKTTFQKSEKSNLENINTVKEIAKIANVSHDTISRVKQIEAKAPEEIKEKLATGEVSINEAFKAVRAIENETNRARIKEELQAIDLKPTEKKYSVIYADPPWMYDGGKPLSDKYGDVQKHYPPMESVDICALPVADLAQNDCVLFLWATAPKLPEALKVIESWGFQYKTCIVWDKVKHNFGFYFSVRHELLLIAGKGKSTPNKTSELHDSVISIERSDKHSEKPEYFRQLIEKMYEGEKIELFARKKSENWDVWGNQA